MNVEPGTNRLEVRLLGPEDHKGERELLADLRLPVTYLGWSFIAHLLQQYSRPTVITANSREEAEQLMQAWNKTWAP